MRAASASVVDSRVDAEIGAAGSKPEDAPAAAAGLRNKDLYRELKYRFFAGGNAGLQGASFGSSAQGPSGSGAGAADSAIDDDESDYDDDDDDEYYGECVGDEGEADDPTRSGDPGGDAGRGDGIGDDCDDRGSNRSDEDAGEDDSDADSDATEIAGETGAGPPVRVDIARAFGGLASSLDVGAGPDGACLSGRAHYFGQFESLIGNPLLSDVRFVFERSGQIVHAHKAILIARSEYFRTMFASGLSEESSDEIVLSDEDDDPTAFLAMLRFVYTGVLAVEVDPVASSAPPQGDVTALLTSRLV